MDYNSFDIKEAQRRKIVSELEELNLDLSPVGYVSDVDLLYIMEQRREDVTSEQTRAIENATKGLNYSKARYALLSIEELKELMDNRPSITCSLSEAVEAFVHILDPYACVVLHANILNTWPLDLEMRDAPIKGPGRVSRIGFSKGRPVALVSDFFGCYANADTKALAWAQMIPASRNPLF